MRADQMPRNSMRDDEQFCDTSLPVMRERKPSEIADKLAEYWKTYNNQHAVNEYNTRIALDDALYGVGIAFSESYRYAQGYDQFKKDLLEFLTTERVDR